MPDYPWLTVDAYSESVISKLQVIKIHTKPFTSLMSHYVLPIPGLTVERKVLNRKNRVKIATMLPKHLFDFLSFIGFENLCSTSSYKACVAVHIFFPGLFL